MTARRDDGRASPAFRLLVVLAVLVLLALGADRGAAFLAERSTAAKVRSALHLAHRPDVHVCGFPFLTQVARRHLGEVDIDAVDVPTGKLTVDRVQARLLGVALDDRYHARSADRVTGTAVAGYPALQAALGRPGATVGYGGKNLVRVDAPLPLLGQSLKVFAYGTVGTKGDTLVAKPQRLQLGQAELPAALVGAVGSQLDLSVPLTDLPPGVHLTRASAAPRGLEVGFAGRRVPLTGTLG